MNINGTIVNYYFFCKRQCYLFYNRINMEDNSEIVKIGKQLHDERKAKKKEISIENIRIDKITDEYITEIKKSDSDITAALWQLKFYMYILHKKGINKDGKLEIIEKNKQDKNIMYIKFSESLILEVENCIKEIENFLQNDEVPRVELSSKCKKCAYYEYCAI